MLEEFAARLPQLRAVVLHSPILSGLRVMYPVKHTCWFDIYKNIDKIPLVNCPVLIIHTSRSLYGALIGSVLAFNVADYLGRRRELVSTALLYLVGALVIALAPNLSILVIGRFVYGIGIGLVQAQLV